MSLKIPDVPTVQNCWDELRPICDEVLRMTRQAPLSEKHRAGLSTMVAVHFFGAAIGDQCRALGDSRPISAVARELADIIVDGLARADRPRVVPTMGEPEGGDG
jgi:hypothetical protein